MTEERKAFRCGFKLKRNVRCEKAWTVIYKRYMHEATTRRSSLVSHVPFSRFFVAGAPAVSEDYAAQCIRFSAYARDATTY